MPAPLALPHPRLAKPGPIQIRLAVSVTTYPREDTRTKSAKAVRYRAILATLAQRPHANPFRASLVPFPTRPILYPLVSVKLLRKASLLSPGRQPLHSASRGGMAHALASPTGSAKARAQWGIIVQRAARTPPRTRAPPGRTTVSMADGAPTRALPVQQASSQLKKARACATSVSLAASLLLPAAVSANSATKGNTSH